MVHIELHHSSYIELQKINSWWTQKNKAIFDQRWHCSRNQRKTLVLQACEDVRKLGYHKLCARGTFLLHYSEEGNGFLDTNVPGVETRCFTAYMKTNNSQCNITIIIHQAQRNEKKNQIWQQKGILLVDFMPQGTNQSAIVQTAEKAEAWTRRLACSVFLLYDNIRPHTAVVTQQLTSMSDHPAHSPDLSLSNSFDLVFK